MAATVNDIAQSIGDATNKSLVSLVLADLQHEQGWRDLSTVELSCGTVQQRRVIIGTSDSGDRICVVPQPSSAAGGEDDGTEQDATSFKAMVDLYNAAKEHLRASGHDVRGVLLAIVEADSQVLYVDMSTDITL